MKYRGSNPAWRHSRQMPYLKDFCAEQVLASSLGSTLFNSLDYVQQWGEMLVVLKEQQARIKPDQMSLQSSQWEREGTQK